MAANNRTVYSIIILMAVADNCLTVIFSVYILKITRCIGFAVGWKPKQPFIMHWVINLNIKSDADHHTSQEGKEK